MLFMRKRSIPAAMIYRFRLLEMSNQRGLPKQKEKISRQLMFLARYSFIPFLVYELQGGSCFCTTILFLLIPDLPTCREGPLEVDAGSTEADLKVSGWQGSLTGEAE